MNTENVYQTPQSDVEIEVESQFTYAGFWVRVAAAIVDTILLMLATYPLLFAVYGVDVFLSEAMVNGLWEVLISYVLPAVIAILFWVYRAATPGKMLFGLRIIRAADGAPISVGQAIGRYFCYYLSTIPLMLGFIWVAFDDRKQGFHDKLAKTLVVKKQ